MQHELKYWECFDRAWGRWPVSKVLFWGLPTYGFNPTASQTSLGGTALELKSATTLTSSSLWFLASAGIAFGSTGACRLCLSTSKTMMFRVLMESSREKSQ